MRSLPKPEKRLCHRLRRTLIKAMLAYFMLGPGSALP